MVDIIFFDVETTGLSFFKHEMIEIGYVNHRGSIEFSFSLDFDESKADPEALAVNGWGKREFAPTVDPHWAAQQIALDWEGKAIVASPTYFDMGFVLAFLEKHDVKPTWSHRTVVDLRSYFLGDRMKSAGEEALSLDDISKKLGVPAPLDRHSALVDAKWMRDLYTEIDG